MSNAMDDEIMALKAEIEALIKSIEKSRSLTTPKIGFDEDAGVISSSLNRISLIPAPIPNGLPLGLTIDDFRYLEYDSNGRLVNFWTKPVKLKGKRA